MVQLSSRLVNIFMAQPSSRLIYRKRAFYMPILYKANFFVVQPSSRLVNIFMVQPSGWLVQSEYFYGSAFFPADLSKRNFLYGHFIQSELFCGSALFPASYCEINIFMDQPFSRLCLSEVNIFMVQPPSRLVIAKLIFSWTSLLPGCLVQN